MKYKRKLNMCERLIRYLLSSKQSFTLSHLFKDGHGNMVLFGIDYERS